MVVEERHSDLDRLLLLSGEDVTILLSGLQSQEDLLTLPLELL